MSLLQIYQWVWQWKNFENRLTFGEVMGRSLVSCFLRHSVYIYRGRLSTQPIVCCTPISGHFGTKTVRHCVQCVQTFWHQCRSVQKTLRTGPSAKLSSPITSPSSHRVDGCRPIGLCIPWIIYCIWNILLAMPSVLWCCWLGGRKGIQPVKNWVVGCWHGCLSGARCWLAYGPADATATHCLLLQ